MNVRDETRLLNQLLVRMTPEERTAYAANWRLRLRECPEKFLRVLADLKVQNRSAIQSAASLANHLWNTFEPRTTR